MLRVVWAFLLNAVVDWWRGFRWWRHCQVCGDPGACHYRQNTQYEDEKSNWVKMCPTCQIANDDHWDQMWAEYWSGRL